MRPMMSPPHRRLLIVSSALLALTCLGSCGDDPLIVDQVDSFDEGMQRLVEDYNLASVAVSVVREREVLFTRAYGYANVQTKAPARPDTIYAMASCSKPIVGLATARLMELHPGFDLDADVNTYLGWTTPLKHPQFEDTPITMRHLLRHQSGIATDAPFDYDTYPKPDPDVPLDTFLREQLTGSTALWQAFEPGKGEGYSNLGTALAGLVIEKVSGRPFTQFCNEEIFTPLGMDSTRWRFDELSAAQQARVARPHRDDLTLYEHYAFNDYPSGSLRTSPEDFSKLLLALLGDGEAGGARILTASSVTAFETVPMLIEAEGGGTFSHDGGESGVNTSFRYRADGSAHVYMINSDLEDDDLDRVQEEIEALIAAQLR